MATVVRGYPATSDRCRGWLRYLHRKATTPDNWDKNGKPHDHWDNITNEPTSSWHRMDLRESSYAMGLMADTTPAWREVYSGVLDELVSRFTGYWAAKDWLDQPAVLRADLSEFGTFHVLDDRGAWILAGAF